MEKKRETPKGWFAFASIAALLLLARYSSTFQSPGPELLLRALLVSMGLMVAIGVVEDAVADGLLKFEGFRLACGIALALATYLARMLGLGDVNSIFHIDPGALPMTVWAATAIHLMSWMFWPMVIASSMVVLKAVVAGLKKFIIDMADLIGFKIFGGKKTVDPTDIWSILNPGAICLACLFGSVYIDHEFTDSGRRHKLYVIALSSDFNSAFSCRGIDANGVVALFIGPDQKRILLAPALPDWKSFKHGGNFTFDTVNIPSEFPVVDCLSPPIDISKWRSTIKEQEDRPELLPMSK